MKGFTVELTGELLEILGSEEEARHDVDIRVLDESGEDYLYPRGWFVPIELPLKAKKALVTIH